MTFRKNDFSPGYLSAERHLNHRLFQNIRVSEHFRVPEIVGYPSEKNCNYPTGTDPKKCFTHTPLVITNNHCCCWYYDYIMLIIVIVVVVGFIVVVVVIVIIII